MIQRQNVIKFVALQFIYNINYIDLKNMTSIPEIAHKIYQEGQLSSTCYSDQYEEKQDQMYQPSFWNNLFPKFVFNRLLTETENSLVWLGSRKTSSEVLALKISQRFQSQSSQKLHQKQQNKFITSQKLKGMAEIKQIVHSEQYRLMAMEFYPYNLQQVFIKRLITNHLRYTKDHFQFVIFVFKAIVEITEELHNAGYVHRDLKPENFLCDHSQNIFLSDFELVCRELDIDTSLSGTLEYMAPERISKIRRNNPITRQNDVWALGIILYELFTGETPFSGETQKEIYEKICQGRIRNKQIPSQAINLINGILQINTSKRLTLKDIKNHPFLQQDLSRQNLKLLQIQKM